MRRLGVALLTIAALGTTAASAADVANGARIARRWCAECHVVADDQKRGSADVPSFQEIARKPAFTVDRLAFFLLDPHPKMPNLSLTRSEAQDLAAYIGSLR
jgi:mono/diheme cytochrome c family protein